MRSLLRVHPPTVLECGRTFLFAAFLAFVAAYGTDRLEVFPRALYWSGLSLTAWALHVLLTMVLHDDSSLRGRYAMMSRVALITIVMTPIVLWANYYSMGIASTWKECVALLPRVSVVVLGMELALFHQTAGEFKTKPQVISAEMKIQGDLSALLPLPLRDAQVLALKAEDHYVRVYTEKGSALIRARLSDLIGKVQKAKGLRPHRSWWVAQRAVKGVTKEGRSYRFQLDGDLEVPVSRAAAERFGRSALRPFERTIRDK